jgi:hypothetical protein
MAEPVAMPLAAGRSMAAPGGRGSPPKPEAPSEARPTPAEITARLSNLAASPPRPTPRLDQQRIPAPVAPRPADARPRPTQFDTVWPAEARAVRQSHSEAVARAPRPEVRPDIRPEPRIEAKLEIRPEPRVEPPTPRVEPAPAANEQRPIAILKSGVIDGMAYTLYTDGSIEAELPQGIMRFASIDELRAHLEKTERQD